MTRRIRQMLVPALLLVGAVLLTGCLHAMQETTCKTKFKKKYKCPFKKIEIVEDELDIGDRIKLRGCGKTVTYDGTTEILVED